MSPLRIAADAEGIVIAILLDTTEVTDVFGTRIGSELDLSEAADLPALRVNTVSTRPIVRRHLDGSSIQLESWGTSRLTAKQNLEVARAAVLADNLEGVYEHAGPPVTELGVLTGITEGTGPVWRPDPVTDTPRWLTTVVVYAHPPAGVP